MKKSLIALPLLFSAVACSQQKAEDTAATDASSTMEIASEGQADVAARPRSESADSVAAAPDIDTSVAPGVAFDFRYNFGLPSERIGGVQEEHAQACKKLGIAKCRVTGMDYKAGNGGDISAMLAFKVDPALATDFTRDAKKIVEQAEGELSNANLTGTDVGSNIAVTEANATEVKAELAKIETQIALPGISKEVRARLVEQTAELREQLRSLSQSKNADKVALTMTPVVFEYQTRHSIPGFNGGSPIAGAAAASVSSFVTMLQFIMVAIGVIAPWALFGGAVFWIVRRFRKKPVAIDAS
jgi:Domain of unknown function (DUF4349)